ncbi:MULTISPECIES: PA2778 family cysteine peptidase [Halomonadaceae]|uniref:PA2778 family cysteine peptidase n=1 Tax=Vreelandella neptunia TaxID=115551 RepID=A0ABZ0YUV3_9GAMM|nr:MULTISPECIES: PA2778 family cysteine peptidase [Halomonas]MDN3559958.1 PA2778 family cysteine peptidase [Halomonas neptunia]TDV95772.1 tetratricopeptide repeat protein [Halomonas alkaliantarctica]WQH15077.1 PA2778 family cysteine peptidase [Halomonas neptunia]
MTPMLLNNLITNARFAGVFILLLLLSGCARNPVLLQSTYQALPPHTEITSVPFYAQTEFQCGPATLAMVLNHQGVDTDVEELIPQVFLPGRDGSVQPEMLATVRRHERIAFPIRGTMDSLLNHLAAGDPVVVMQNLSLPIYPMWHYAVAIGYDLPNETLILRSGEIERHTMSFSRFDATWARTERWGFVVGEPGTIPAGITARNALEALSAYEESHGPRATLSSWQAFVKRHPTNAMGQFALGNALYADQQPDDARKAFERATELDEKMGAAWLNLGLLLLQDEATNAAREALTQAASLDGSWQEKARQALARINNI